MTTGKVNDKQLDLTAGKYSGKCDACGTVVQEPRALGHRMAYMKLCPVCIDETGHPRYVQMKRQETPDEN